MKGRSAKFYSPSCLRNIGIGGVSLPPEASQLTASSSKHFNLMPATRSFNKSAAMVGCLTFLSSFHTMSSILKLPTAKSSSCCRSQARSTSSTALLSCTSMRLFGPRKKFGPADLLFLCWIDQRPALLKKTNAFCKRRNCTPPRLISFNSWLHPSMVDGQSHRC